MNNHKIFRLKGQVQHYAWGGYTYIPSLLNINNTNHQPFAEYWMGIHPSAISQIEVNGHWELLTSFLQQNPTALSKSTNQLLNQSTTQPSSILPYLFKVLDVRAMLSIQVHPTKMAATEGFEREEKLGIPINASNRNYKDKNHKPEVMVALSPFWLLHGFKPALVLKHTLQQIDAFYPFLSIFNDDGYEALYKQVMEMPQTQVDTLLQPLLQKIVPLYQQQKLNKNNPDFWAARAVINSAHPYKNIDRGIFSIYFFNLLQLKSGEAIFQGAGVPHAYLEGVNVELMANSDNVLRGGLTPKYIDVKELIQHIIFEGITPHIFIGKGNTQEKIYHCPVPDFCLSAISLSAGSSITQYSQSFEIGIVIEGQMQIEAKEEKKILHTGESFAVAAHTNYTITTQSCCVMYKAFVPVV